MSSLDREEILRLLPCYRLEQLDPEEADAVRRALHEDPSLRGLLASVQEAERLCASAFRERAPASLRTLAPVGQDRRKLLHAVWAWLAWAVSAAALLVLVLAARGQPVDAGRLRVYEDLLIAADVGGDSLIPADSPSILQQALLAQGVAVDFSHVADLRSLGLTLEGGLVSGGRVASVWREAGGGTVLCVTGPRLEIHRTPDQVHRPDMGDGPVLQGHALQGYSAVYWEQDGRGSALVGGAGLDEVAALAFRAVWKPAGA